MAIGGGDLGAEVAAGDVVPDRVVDPVGGQPLQEPGVAAGQAPRAGHGYAAHRLAGKMRLWISLRQVITMALAS